MTQSALALVQVAEGQVNYVEGGGRDGHSGNLTKFGQAYGLNGYAWCSIFVWWCFHQLGIDVRQVVSKNYAGAEQAMEGFAAHGWKISGSSHDARMGDVVFFHFDGEHSGANHTGIVIDHDAGGVHTIEGNTSQGPGGSQVNGGGVYRRYRPWSVIIGYGRYPFKTPSGRPAAPPKPAPAATKTYPTLSNGMGSKAHPDPKVKRLQNLLHIPADGIFRDGTERAVENYQASHGLRKDGVAGPATLRKLGY